MRKVSTEAGAIKLWSWRTRKQLAGQNLCSYNSLSSMSFEKPFLDYFLFFFCNSSPNEMQLNAGPAVRVSQAACGTAPQLQLCHYSLCLNLLFPPHTIHLGCPCENPAFWELGWELGENWTSCPSWYFKNPAFVSLQGNQVLPWFLLRGNLWFAPLP